MEQNKFSISLNSDKKLLSRTASTERILELHLQAPTVSKSNGRPSLNLALVLDRSGSMQGEKLEYVKQAASHVLDQLNERDQVALVVYDNTIQVLARSTSLTEGSRLELKQRLSALRAGDMTDLCDGWLTGCREIATAARDGSLNRALLLTDGLANVGQIDPEVLAQHAFELYKDSITTSTFGVGEGFNEHLLEAMANRGGGNFFFIPNPDQIPAIFLQEFHDLVSVAVRNVEVKLALPASVEWHVLGGWTSEYMDGQLHIHIGDMLSGKLQDIYLRLQIPVAENLVDISFEARAFGKSESGHILDDQVKVTFTLADQDQVEAEATDRQLMQRYSAVELADEATEALKLERQGRREEAEQRLHSSLHRNMPYVAAQVAIDYDNMSQRMRTGMTEQDRKHSHWDSYNRKRQKNQDKEKEEDK